MSKKIRLIAGTINHYPDDEEFRNIHLDASPRLIYDAELDTMLAPDIVADLGGELPMLLDEYFDEVRCHHVLEHMNFKQATRAVNAIYRVLKPDGVFDVETPDMQKIVEAWVHKQHTEADLQQWIHGEDLDGEFDGHRYSWSARSLQVLIQRAGFKIFETPEAGLAVRYRAHKRWEKPHDDGA